MRTSDAIVVIETHVGSKVCVSVFSLMGAMSAWAEQNTLLQLLTVAMGVCSVNLLQHPQIKWITRCPNECQRQLQILLVSSKRLLESKLAFYGTHPKE